MAGRDAGAVWEEGAGKRPAVDPDRTIHSSDVVVPAGAPRRGPFVGGRSWRAVTDREIPMTDKRFPAHFPRRTHGGAPLVPASGPLSRTEEWPSLDQDLEWLAWLQSSPNLSAQSSGYICDALLQWAMLGEQWPDPVEPPAGPECDHLDFLCQVTQRLSWRIHDIQPVSRKFQLAGIARELANAIACQRDPELLRGSLDRELVHRMPWLATAPAPVRLADGRVL